MIIQGQEYEIVDVTGNKGCSGCAFRTNDHRFCNENKLHDVCCTDGIDGILVDVKNGTEGVEHYNKGSIEVIEAIEDWELGFNLGNVIKYTARAGKKGSDTKEKDLRKAISYLNRELTGKW